MPLKYKQLPRPILVLSPMADMTDQPFCRTVKKVVSDLVDEPRLIMFREMVSAEAVVRGNDKTLRMAEFTDSERPIVQQIFGADPKSMADAARIIEDKFRPDGIDINMGCPAYKITSSFNGAALMKDPDLASTIVREVKKAVSVPVSVKMRAGWSNPEGCIEFAPIIQAAGADLISIHGRTKTQGYSGTADREVIHRVRKLVTIPLLYNGDILTWQDYFEAVDATECAGALIARGALGNPWIFSQIELKLNDKTPISPTLAERIDVVKHHLNLHLEHYGERSLPTFRKHLSWYFKSQPHFKQYKQRMMTTTSVDELNSILDEIQK
ncbi:MAG: tRNA dihydrouridine synthase DusB [bacterium]